MKWQDVRERYPNEWVLMEAIETHEENGILWVDNIAVIDSFCEGNAAMKAHSTLQQKAPHRQLYFYHTHHESVTIEELNYKLYDHNKWHKFK